jgi:hypothetical protein
VTVANENLSQAKRAKNDEFYTQYPDIEKEMNAYLDFNADVFRGKTILLPCDDPEWSNFTKYFVLNFERVGLKKLISTSYAFDSRAINMLSGPTEFESRSPKFDPSKTRSRGKIFTLTGDQTRDGRVDFDDIEWEYLDGDGDFRSDEVKRLRDEADVIITNPPFSLFREFLAWIVEAEKQFVILGNMNAITYKEVFPLIKDNRLWLGGTGGGSMWFRVASGVPRKDDQRIEGEKRYQSFRNINWFTNLDHGRRHEPLALMTTANNIKFSKHKEVRGVGYQTYDNFDAIEVSHADAIPSDHEGVMGVPISWLDKYNPEQFEILGSEKDWEAGKIKIYPKQVQVTAAGKRSNVTKLNDGATLKLPARPKGETYYEVNGKVYTQVYKRIFIQHRSPTT